MQMLFLSAIHPFSIFPLVIFRVLLVCRSLPLGA